MRRGGFGSYMAAPGLTRIDAVCETLRAVEAGAMTRREAARALVRLGGLEDAQAAALVRWAFGQWVARVTAAEDDLAQNVLV